MSKKSNQELQKKLEEAQKAQNKKKTQSMPNNDKIKSLQTKIQELEDVSKRAQFDYINLKADFDLLQRQTDQKEKSMKEDILISTIQNFLPFVEELRKSIDNIPQDKKDDPLTKWLQMTYNKFIKNLETHYIFSIESIWLEPDGLLHEPVSTTPTTDPKLKGKIIQEFQRWFYYQKPGEDKKIITTSKVIIGQ